MQTRLGLSQIILGFIRFTIALVEIVLFFRILLRFLDANKNNEFVRVIHDMSMTLLYPFRGIFSPSIIDGRFVIDFTALFAMLVYLVLLYLIEELVYFLSYKSRSYRK